jgi:hypothetical protein
VARAQPFIDAFARLSGKNNAEEDTRKGRIFGTLVKIVNYVDQYLVVRRVKFSAQV